MNLSNTSFACGVKYDFKSNVVLKELLNYKLELAAVLIKASDEQGCVYIRDTFKKLAEL